jgi:predicted nucleic acid-binding protein
MFLIDSSAWIEYLRPNGSQRVKERIRNILQQEKAVCCGIVVVEILRGAKTEKDFQMLRNALTALPQIPIDATVIERAAKWGFLLDRKGKDVSTTDLLIASASYKQASIVHLDRDFQMIAAVVELEEEKL